MYLRQCCNAVSALEINAFSSHVTRVQGGDSLEKTIMKTTLKLLVLGAVVAASASSAFAANRHIRGYGQSAQFENYGAATDRDSMVEQTGN